MENFQYELISLFENMNNAYEEYAKSKNTTSFFLTVFKTVCMLGDGCTQKQISDLIRYPKQSVNLAIKTFIKDGYIELRKKPRNRRSKQIFLTPSGKDFRKKTVDPLLKREKFVFSQVAENDTRKLVDLLKGYGKLYCSNIKEII